MQAILIKYLPATNYRPSRLKASCERGSVTICYQSHCDNPEHAALRALLRKLIAEDKAKYGPDAGKPWHGPWVMGQLASGDYIAVSTKSAEVVHV